MGRSLFDVVQPAFPLPTTALPTVQGALKDGFGEAVVIYHDLKQLVHATRRKEYSTPNHQQASVMDEDVVLRIAATAVSRGLFGGCIHYGGLR